MTSSSYTPVPNRSPRASANRTVEVATLAALAPFLLLVLVFVFAGLTGHDPWKADEAYIFGIIHSILDEGSWLVPMLAGEPFMEKPPLYAWCAALLVRLLAGVPSEPDAARLVSGCFMVMTCGAVAVAARNWWGDGMGRFAPIMLIACLGLTVQSHMMMPDVPLLTAFACGAWAFSVIRTRPGQGGLLLGLATGIGFLSKGLLGPGVLGLTALLLPICFRQWRNRQYFSGLATALCVAFPMLTVWPALLYLRSPELFHTWFWDNNFGRYFGFAAARHGTEHEPFFWLQTLPWFAFPALPLALLVTWQRRREFATNAGLQCGVLMSGVTMLVLSTSASARAVYAMPLLVPLAILATPSVQMLRTAAARLWVMSSVLLFGALAGTVWVGWLLMMTTGAPPQWPWLTRLLPADYIPNPQPFALLVAAAATAAAMLIVFHPRMAHSQGRPLLVWTAGVALVWTLLSTLWMPWLDYAKSYRTVFENIPWPASYRCIASINLGESERAMLDYYTDRVTERQENGAGAGCDLMLLQGYAPKGIEGIDSQRWQLAWTGARPGDTWQQFWLFRAKSAAKQTAATSEPYGD